MSRDPYKYYRVEARELIEGLSAGVLALAAQPADPEQVSRLLRLAHTLKGAARVVRQTATGETAHRFEELLEPYRAPGNAVSRESIPTLLQCIDAMRADVDLLSPSSGAAAVAPTPPQAPIPATTRVAPPSAPTAAPLAVTPAEAPGDARFETVRADIREMDRLLENVSIVSVQVERLRRELGELQGARAQARGLAQNGGARGQALAPLLAQLDSASRHLAAGIDHSARGLREAQEKINALRLLPASTVFASLERAVYDAASALGKDVRLLVSGGEQKLEAHILAPVADALLHLVRNAVDHGIESAAERQAAGKPAQGRIELSVERRGGLIAISARDDGRGIDLESVRARARASGRLSAEQADALDLPGAIELLLRGGLSTKLKVTDISGRGIGLDAARDIAARLKGSVNVRSEPGIGTVVELRVPASLTRLPALLLAVGGQLFSIPLTAVEKALRLDRAAITASSEGELLTLGEEALPYARLAELVGAPTGRETERVTALLVQGPAGRAVIAVDRLVGQEEILLRPLPATLGKVELFMGLSLDADGDPQPMLDAEGIVLAVRAQRGTRPVAVERQRAKILVIDDSLTTRMLEQSILESAGFEVALATSGEEGLSMARQRRYDLFITDIEMPGMSGFDFIAATRADPKLRETPGIVVSSLHSVADKARGAEVGARAYIVKGEFEQGRFLDTVRTLVG